MDLTNLVQFDLIFPSPWIDSSDRDWAFETNQILHLMNEKFVCAVISYANFKPLAIDNLDKFHNQSKYEKSLNEIFAESFIFSLNSISKIIHTLERVPARAVKLISKYDKFFGHLKHMRDSIAHIEDRGRGLDRNQSHLPTMVIFLGVIVGNKFQFSGNDGKLYSIEISESTLQIAHGILQGIINGYTWENSKFHNLSIAK